MYATARIYYPVTQGSSSNCFHGDSGSGSTIDWYNNIWRHSRKTGRIIALGASSDVGTSFVESVRESLPSVLDM